MDGTPAMQEQLQVCQGWMDGTPAMQEQLQVCQGWMDGTPAPRMFQTSANTSLILWLAMREQLQVRQILGWAPAGRIGRGQRSSKPSFPGLPSQSLASAGASLRSVSTGHALANSAFSVMKPS